MQLWGQEWGKMPTKRLISNSPNVIIQSVLFVSKSLVTHFLLTISNTGLIYPTTYVFTLNF
jgi:hypothetical protein